MAHDDDERGSAPDPWDEIVADGLSDEFGEDTVPFAEAAAEPPVEPFAPQGDPAEPGEDVAAAAAEAVRGDAEDASIEDWLTSDDGAIESASPALSVFAPEENAAGLSGIDVETSGVDIAREGEPATVLDEALDDALAGAADVGGAIGDAWVDTEPGSAADSGDGTEGTVDITAAAAAPVIVPASDRERAKQARKSGGLGKVAGIALGGLLAIPAAGAILLYGLGQDPLGIARVMPSALVPAKFQPRKPPLAAAVEPVAPSPPKEPAAEPTPESVSAEPAAEPGAAESVAADPVAADSVVPEPAAAPEPAAVAAALPVSDEPPEGTTEEIPTVPTDVAAVDAVVSVEPPPEPQPGSDPDPESMPIPEPVPPLDALAVDAPDLDAPGLDALVTDGPASSPAPGVQPVLDTAALDEAVGEAAALGEALGAADDRENRAYTLLRTRWYRSLARMAEELVALDHAAAASGRPLDALPENVAVLHGTIGDRAALAAELARLAPDWLSYAKRGSDGVVLPVTLESARKVGPYWTARATLMRPDGTSQALTLISRTEPRGVPGDMLVVTGVALEGAVIWAADVREAPAGGEAVPGS